MLATSAGELLTNGSYPEAGIQARISDVKADFAARGPDATASHPVGRGSLYAGASFSQNAARAQCPLPHPTPVILGGCTTPDKS